MHHNDMDAWWWLVLVGSVCAAWHGLYMRNMDRFDHFPCIRGPDGTEAGPSRPATGNSMALWRWQYKQRGWSSFVGLRQKCGLNTPYILFKAKNVTDATTRKDKLYKVRPIAPGTKHPMKPLLELVGRAWHFISKQVPGENFVINSGEEVPAFLEEAQTKLRPQGKMEIRIRDIDSCYPFAVAVLGRARAPSCDLVVN